MFIEPRLGITPSAKEASPLDFPKTQFCLKVYAELSQVGESLPMGTVFVFVERSNGLMRAGRRSNLVITFIDTLLRFLQSEAGGKGKICLWKLKWTETTTKVNSFWTCTIGFPFLSSPILVFPYEERR